MNEYTPYWEVSHLSSDRSWDFSLRLNPPYTLAYANADLEGEEVLKEFLDLNPYELAWILNHLPFHTGQNWGFLYLGDCGMRITNKAVRRVKK